MGGEPDTSTLGGERGAVEALLSKWSRMTTGCDQPDLGPTDTDEGPHSGYADAAPDTRYEGL